MPERHQGAQMLIARSKLASVALRVSNGSRRRSSPSSSNRSKAIRKTCRTEGSRRKRSTPPSRCRRSHRLTVDQAGAHLEPVHRLHDQRESCPFRPQPNVLPMERRVPG
jgi:hypothetical protein